MSNRKRRQAIYVITTDRGVCKVGISDNPELRLAQLQTGAPYPIRLVYAAVHSDAQRVETVVHHMLRRKLCYGEWFSVTDAEAIATIGKAAAQIGKPIVGSGFVTPQATRLFWFKLGLAVLAMWALFSFLFALSPGH